MSTSPTWLRCLSEVIKTHPKAKRPATATPSAYSYRVSRRLYPFPQPTPHDPQTANRHRCGNRVPLPGS